MFPLKKNTNVLWIFGLYVEEEVEKEVNLNNR